MYLLLLTCSISCLCSIKDFMAIRLCYSFTSARLSLLCIYLSLCAIWTQVQICVSILTQSSKLLFFRTDLSW